MTQQPIQRPHKAPTSAGGKVVVCCKLPSGLRLRVFQMIDQNEATPLGMKSIKIAQQIGQDVLVKGSGRHDGLSDMRYGNAPVPNTATFGYGLTHGVDEDFWNLWLEQNNQSDLVKNRLIFALPDVDNVTAFAREHEKQRSGLEPIDPQGDQRVRQIANGRKVEPLKRDEPK